MESIVPENGPPRPRTLLAETKALLREAGLQARKGLGQHFLVDGSYIKHILTAAELRSSDTVIEVGPGLGTLTEALTGQAGRVLAIEKDSNLATLLRKRLADRPNLCIVNEDILSVDVPSLLAECSAGTDYKVVANLPYYITSPVLRLFLEGRIKPSAIVVMVQKEVARQITARPGEMSILSVAVQLYGEPRIVKYVPARAFYPPPEVDSAILKTTVFARPRVEADTTEFFAVVKAGFSAARKQLVNSLSHGLDLPKEQTLAILGRAGVEPSRRAETLTIEEWASVLNQWRSQKGPALT
jgi:16S rRNA (adenine1518-N6/adenine1519-N6)-dimethyltransferase